MKYLYAATLALIVLAFASPARASEGQTPPNRPHVTCTTVTIDPEPTWHVTLVGTIGGTHVSLVMTQHAAGVDQRVHDISQFTTADGPIVWTLTPEWVVGLPNPKGYVSGPGVTTSGTLHCHTAPTTTTTEATTATTTTISSVPVQPPHKVVIPPTTTTTVAVSPTSVLPPSPPVLPHTGSDTVPLAVGGAVTVLAGLAGIAGRRRGRLANNANR